MSEEETQVEGEEISPEESEDKKAIKKLNSRRKERASKRRTNNNKKKKNKKKIHFNFTKYSITLLILSLILLVPIFIGLVGLGNNGVKFSIYNTGWDGLSVVADDLRGGNAYEVNNTMSGLTVLNRLNNTGILVIIGPTTKFDFSETISLFTFLVRGGGLIVADDFGTGNDIFAPIWNIIRSYDSLVQLGVVPSLTELIFGNQSASQSDVTSVEDIASVAIFKMLAGMLKAIAFNQTVLMDAGSNYNGISSEPLLKHSNPDNPLTQGITKGIQMEFGTTLSVKINNSFYNSATHTYEWRTDWVPLQPLSINITIEGGEYGNMEPIELHDVMLPFLPFFTTTNSWMESNLRAAKHGDAVPNVGEWGNTAFSPMLSIPIGKGKIVMISDPDIFINKWVRMTDENDNLIFIRNLFSYVASDMNSTGPVPIIFDEGHAEFMLYNAALYSTILMRLITEMSMFPLYAPLVPLAFGIMAYPLIPKSRRLAPVLWTKYRGEAGKSRFEREIRRILETGSYSEAVGLLYRAMLRGVRKAAGSAITEPKELAAFFIERGYSMRKGALASEFERISRYLARPKLLPSSEFEKMMQFIKNMIDMLPK